MENTVVVADVFVIILAAVVMATPWISGKGRFGALVIATLIFMVLILFCGNDVWIRWLEFLKVYWYLLFLPLLVFIIGIFASKAK